MFGILPACVVIELTSSTTKKNKASLVLIGSALFAAASVSLAQVTPPEIEKPVDPAPPTFEAPVDGQPIFPAIPQRPTVVVPTSEETEDPTLPERPTIPESPAAMFEMLIDMAKELKALKDASLEERKAIRETIKETLAEWVAQQREQAKETAEAAKAIKDNLPSVSDIVESAKSEGRGR